MPETDNLPWQEVTSSNIASVAYVTETSTLYIAFKGNSIYAYSDVSPDVAAGLLTASSVGSYFAKNIRDHYATRKL